MDYYKVGDKVKVNPEAAEEYLTDFCFNVYGCNVVRDLQEHDILTITRIEVYDRDKNRIFVHGSSPTVIVDPITGALENSRLGIPFYIKIDKSSTTTIHKNICPLCGNGGTTGLVSFYCSNITCKNYKP